LLQDGRVPIQVKLGNAVVGDGQRPGPRVAVQVEIRALDDDERAAVRGYDGDGDPQRPGFFDRLVAGDDPAQPVCQDGPPRAVLAQRVRQQSPSAGRPAIGVA